MSKKMKIVIISIVITLILLLCAYVLYVIFSNNDKGTINQTDDEQNISINVTLPNIAGDSNVTKTEFERKENISELLDSDKTWKDLIFKNFNVYSLQNGTSVLEYDIVNENNYLIETSKYQLQLLNDNLEIVSVIDFDELSVPVDNTIHVTVNITGDVTNLKDIKVDNINYKMNMGGGN